MLLLQNKRLSGLYAILIVGYLSLSVLSPLDDKDLAKYNLDATQARLLVLTIAIPYIVIWLIALIGYLRLNAYVALIKKDKDGAAFKTITQGVLLLALWLPLSTITTSIFRLIYDAHPSMTANLVRLDNYLSVIYLFAAFVVLYIGTRKLLPLVKRPRFLSSEGIVLAYIAFSALYVMLIFQDPAHEFPTESVTQSSYYEPAWLIVISLAIPRLIYWFLGIQAVQNIYIFSKHVKGKLYQRALSNLAIGLAGVITMTIVLRCLQSLSSVFGDLGLGVVLLIVYLLLISISIGYVFIAKGAKSLQKLEES